MSIGQKQLWSDGVWWSEKHMPKQLTLHKYTPYFTVKIMCCAVGR